MRSAICATRSKGPRGPLRSFALPALRPWRSSARMLLIPLPEACKVKEPVQDLIMETRPVLCIFWLACGPQFKFMKTTP